MGSAAEWLLGLAGGGGWGWKIGLCKMRLTIWVKIWNFCETLATFFFLLIICPVTWILGPFFTAPFPHNYSQLGAPQTEPSAWSRTITVPCESPTYLFLMMDVNKKPGLNAFAFRLLCVLCPARKITFWVTHLSVFESVTCLLNYLAEWVPPIYVLRIHLGGVH